METCAWFGVEGEPRWFIFVVCFVWGLLLTVLVGPCKAALWLFPWPLNLLVQRVALTIDWNGTVAVGGGSNCCVCVVLRGPRSDGPG